MGNALGKQFSLSEKNERINGVGDMPNQHDILTGSQPDGRAYTDAADHTCNNWTSNAEGPARGAPPAAPGTPSAVGAARTPRQAGRRKLLLELDAREPRLQPGEPGGHRRRGSAVLLRGELRAG